MIIINESFVITGKEDLESFIADLQPFAISDHEKIQFTDFKAN